LHHELAILLEFVLLEFDSYVEDWVDVVQWLLPKVEFIKVFFKLIVLVHLDVVVRSGVSFFFTLAPVLCEVGLLF